LIRTFDTPIHTNDQSVDRVLAAGLPVVLVFVNSPIPVTLKDQLNRLAQTYAGQAILAEINLKENPATASKYAITQAPAVVTFKNSKVQTQAQAINGPQIEQHLLFLLGKGPQPEVPRPSPAPGQATAGAASQGQPITVTDATFQREVLQSSLPVLVDFWAPWCGPCRMVAPTVEKMAREMAGKARFAKVNVDENPQIASQYGIYSIPTMMVVKNGQIVDRWAGALPEPALRSRVTPQLANR
jgi:thioredoxin 1